jgi:glycosyltransferase involved in cell wall biosynthesis
MKTKVYIYGFVNIYYDSFYIKGLKNIYQNNIKFDLDKFPKFENETLAIIISENGTETKIIIDSRDTNSYYDDELQWCDVYGKANFNEQTVPDQHRHKILNIGPSFGIQIWNFRQTITLALIHYFKFRHRIKYKRHFFANYWRQYKRLPLEYYQPSQSSSNFIFFISTIWKKEPYTNKARAAYIMACQNNPDIIFEGGFAPRTDGDQQQFDNLTVPNRYSLQEYISKIKSSFAVFNTPAVLSCHGWKIAEFLALGKAIISTRHVNEFPEELAEGVHALYVDSLDDIDEKLELLLRNQDLKLSLENNARKYYDEVLAPEKILYKLLQAKQITSKAVL